jgi:hypothetical protein
MISEIPKIEEADIISDAVPISFYLDFRPIKHFSQYPRHSRLKRIEPAAMSDDDFTDDEMTLEEEKRLKKLKEQSNPLAGLAFIYSQTREYDKLLKKDRKRKEAKLQKEKRKSEDPVSPRVQEENISSGSNSNQEPSDRIETTTPPLHVVSNLKLCAPWFLLQCGVTK